MKKLLLFLTLGFLFGCGAAKKSQPSVANAPLSNDPSIHVMSFNVRCISSQDVDLMSWESRKDYVVDIIRRYKTDVFGVQELTVPQKEYMEQTLTEYASYGMPRSKSKNTEYSMIYFNKQRFELQKSGYFWLADEKTPEGVAAWDARYPRLANWVILKDKVTGKSFFFLNTHYDHVGKKARYESSRLVLQCIREEAAALPAIVVGDLNARPAENSIEIMESKQEPYAMTQAGVLAKEVFGPKWTFHNYGRIAPEKRYWIDYIFLRNIKQVLKFGVIDENRNGQYASDHAPIMSTLILD